MGIGKNNSPQNPTVRIKNVAQPVGQVQAGPSTNPSAGYVMEASTPPMTTPLTSNSNPVNTISPTYGNKDNRLSSVKNNNLSSIGNITTQPNNLTNIGLQPQQEITEVNTQPTLQDFIAEAQKLGQEQVIANIDPNFANDLARQLYGQNVGMSGLGTGVVSNAFQDLEDRILTAYTAAIEVGLRKSGGGHKLEPVGCRLEEADGTAFYSKNFGQFVDYSG